MKTIPRKVQEIRRMAVADMTCPACKKLGIITRTAIVCECGEVLKSRFPLDELRLAFEERANQYADEEQPELRKCQKCNGTGDVKCGDCDGTGEDDCPHCGNDMDCKECDGTGEVECKKCDGSGYEEQA